MGAIKIWEKKNYTFSFYRPFSVKNAIFRPVFNFKNSPKFEIGTNHSEICLE